jgi:hypothetical protein
MSEVTEPTVIDTAPETMTADEAVQAALAYEGQLRLWMRGLIKIVELKPSDDDHNPRVQLALDWMRVAAAEAIGRICARVSPGRDEGLGQ